VNQLVQTAIAAARQGDKPKAIELLREALCTNPNDIEAWLVLSRLVDQPERKRQCLNRVLALDAGNKIAREELLKLDRAAMGVPRIQTTPFDQTRQSPDVFREDKPAPAFAAKPSPFTSSSFSTSELPTVPPESVFAPVVPAAPQTASPAKPPVQKSAAVRAEKPLVFKYPIFWRILIYLFMALFGCAGLLVAVQDVMSSLPILGLAVLMGISALYMFQKVEITETWIRASTAFTSSEIKWSDIARLKSSALKQRLELFRSNGQVVKISTQVSGYPRIVETLRQKRPDLFGKAASSPSQGNAFTAGNEQPSNVYGSPGIAPAFSGTKKFEKSFFRQYGSYFLVIPLCLFAVWAVFTEPEQRLGASLFIVFCLVLMILPLFQVSGIKVEANKLTIETLFGEKELSARQIKEIKMQSVRGRRGRVTNFVNIIPVEGKNYPLTGFSAGDEIIYGFLKNWWDTYRNR